MPNRVPLATTNGVVWQSNRFVLVAQTFVAAPTKVPCGKASTFVAARARLHAAGTLVWCGADVSTVSGAPKVFWVNAAGNKLTSHVTLATDSLTSAGLAPTSTIQAAGTITLRMSTAATGSACSAKGFLVWKVPLQI